MAPVFVTSGSALAGNPLHVTVYDGNGNPVDNTQVVWTGLPATCTVSEDPSVPGGFIFVSSVTGFINATAKVGAASAMFSLNFLGLKFSSP